MEWLNQDPNVQDLVREWEDKGRAKGRLEGRVNEARIALHTVLAARSLTVSEDTRARIEAETDADRLTSWLKAAATATAIDDVFREHRR